LDIKLVEIRISILRADPKETQTRGAGQWATAVIENYSGHSFSVDAKNELLENKLIADGVWDPNFGYRADGTFGPCARSTPCVTRSGPFPIAPRSN